MYKAKKLSWVHGIIHSLYNDGDTVIKITSIINLSRLLDEALDDDDSRDQSTSSYEWNM